jgi:flagellar basal-body rod protein FlgC
MTDLTKVMDISTAGMEVQGTRLKVIAENLANSNSLATTPGGDPYRRKTISFKNELDRATGENKVAVSKIGTDNSDFTQKYDPTNPAADAKGYIKTPNVNSLVEAMDMREAQRSYEANVNMVEVSKSMLLKTINMLQ